ncbi:hypothetical protein EYZ11_010454 [Aspergillus tanneri]|uniref:Uncharacterized protein n=1 Tax=Aspergillus tanneri TaxID=1220188 RepID=A0A4S3J5C3_9EURO|nr:hypothetical protein EYZ11_010454 [Aspergillus tanneri]
MALIYVSKYHTSFTISNVDLLPVIGSDARAFIKAQSQ